MRFEAKLSKAMKSLRLKGLLVILVLVFIPIATAIPQNTNRNTNYGRRQPALVVPPRAPENNIKNTPLFSSRVNNDNYGGLAETRKVVQNFGEQLQNLNQQSEFETPNYDFKYQVHGGGNLFGHEESRQNVRATGRYHTLLPDGRRQIVSYYADETGYHPTVTYEVVSNPNSDARSNPDDGYRSKRSRNFRHSKRVPSYRPKKSALSE